MPQPFVQVDHLGKRYGEQWALHDASFEVGHGEIFGVIGHNGAGKTTTLKTLAGLLTPTEGSVTVGGLSVEDPEHKRRIGYLPEESPLYEDMTPVAYLRFFGDLYGIPRKVVDERIEEALTLLDLDVRHEKRIGDFSKGMTRKVAIARSLVNDPDLLIYDEPASGLDPVVSAHVLDLVRELRGKGKTVVFSAHNLYHVERICDRLLILHKGRILASGTMKEIRAHMGRTEYVVRVTVPLDDTWPVENGYETVVADFADVQRLEHAAKEAGGRLLEAREKELSLEDIFLKAAAR